MILWLFKMSSTSDIVPTATNDKLPIMPSDGCGSGNSTNSVLNEFVKILLQSKACSREYCEMTKRLTLVFYDKTHTGCKVIIYLIGHRITIIDFLHLNILKEADYTFNRTGFDQYVMSFLTPAEVEKQKRFDEFQYQQEILMAKQRQLQRQEKKRQDEALEKAHQLKPRQCGGVANCNHCKNEEKILIHNAEIQRRIAFHNAEIQRRIAFEAQYGPNWQSIVGRGYT